MLSKRGLRQTKFLSLIFLFIAAVSCTSQDPEIYVFSFFQNNGEDGLHLAYSEDGLNWTALGNNRSFLKPAVGVDKLMRDPCIIKGGDGKFHMVWTVSWNERGIGYANSTDLINWSEQKYIPVMHHEPEARNCWAPELFYDYEKDQYMVYWATTIPGRFAETDSTGDNGYNHRMYYTTTNDFNTFTDTKLLYDHGFNVIDATIQRAEDRYVMFLKNETRYPQAQKNIRIATSNDLLWKLFRSGRTYYGKLGGGAYRRSHGLIVDFVFRYVYRAQNGRRAVNRSRAMD